MAADSRRDRPAVAKRSNRSGPVDSFATLTVIDQTGCQYVGIVVIKVVEQLVDILANGNFKLHAKIIGELLRQFIIKANNFAVNVAVNQRRVERTDAQLPRS